MKYSKTILIVAAQFLAVAAIAQTDTESGAMTSFGSDWSTSLGAALIGEDGAKAMTADEVATQWETMSDADKDMIRRDCAAHMATSADAGMSSDGTSTADTGTAVETDTTANTDTTADTTMDSDTTMGMNMMPVTTAQMDVICDGTVGM